MRIGINTAHLLKGKLEGIGWFAHETLKRLVRNHPEHEFVFFFDRKWDDEFLYAENVVPVKTVLPARHPVLWWWHNQIELKQLVKRYQIDLFYSPDGWMPLGLKIPVIDVIHDINFMHRNDKLPLLTKWYYRYFFPKFAHKSSRVLTVSEYSKTDLVDTFLLSPDKVDVIFNGVNDIYQPLAKEVQIEVKNKVAEGAPYFIYVGSINSRKNIIGMLKAFDQFKLKYKTAHKFVFVGSPMWNDNEFELSYNNLQFKKDVLRLGRLDIESLNLVLGSAEALLLVSFFEGFGIPIIEAMACDVPVITSNNTSMPEIAGDAAIIVDPKNVDEIANAMHQIADNNDFRNSMIEKGRKQRDLYTWDNSADKVWESFQKVIDL